MKIVDVALATSAAPTYFKRHAIKLNEYVDGGLFANNPSLLGLHEAEIFFDKSKDNIHILSIGTLSSKKSINPKSSKSGGLFDWGEGNPIKAADHIIDLVLSSQQMFMQQVVSHRLKHNLIHIDETIGEASSEFIGLDETTEVARQVLTSNAEQSSKTALGLKNVRDFFTNKVNIPTWYSGPQKNNQGD